MIRWIVSLLGLALAATASMASASPLEIGYVESFDRKAELYSIVSEGVPRKVAILTPILNGDVIEVRDPGARITLRLIDRPEPIIVSQANQGVPITAEAPQKSFWSGLFSWTGASVEVFDEEQREQVTASIRGDEASELVAPLLSGPQTILAERRPLAIGWVSPRTVDIRILSKSGKVVASGRGSGGLWMSPAIDWKAGTYRVELKAGGETLVQTVQVVRAGKMASLPPELGDPAAPEALLAVATAAWYAAKDPRYLLEALQHVAADARASRPAKLLTLAFIDGKRPSPP